MTVLTLPIRGHITNSKLVRQCTKIIYVQSIITIITQCVCVCVSVCIFMRARLLQLVNTLQSIEFNNR